jgi:hypothetical protein
VVNQEATKKRSLVANVLSKETVHESDEEQDKKKLEIRRVKRMMSTRQRLKLDPSAPVLELTESCGKCLQSDLNNLLKELSIHFRLLKEDEDSHPTHQEFQGIPYPPPPGLPVIGMPSSRVVS